MKPTIERCVLCFLGILSPTLLVTFLSSLPGDTAAISFSERAREAGLDFEHVSGPPFDKRYLFEVKGGGTGFADFDNDGWTDILMVQGSTLEGYRQGGSPKCQLFRNQGDGKFRNVSAQAGLKSRGWGMGVALADYDNDGFVDIYLTDLGPNTLYRNQGDGTFRDVSETAGVAGSHWSSSAAFSDFDLDGDLDLYVANYVDINFDQLPPPDCVYRGTRTICGPRGLKGAEDILYRNNGDGTFSDVSGISGVRDSENLFGLGALWSDLDNDRDPDLYVANDFGPNLLYLNQGDGTFQESAFVAGLALSGDGLEQAGMGVDAADYDNDGWLDIFVTHFASDYSTLYRNRGQLMFEDFTGRSGIQQAEWFLVSWGTHFGDFDHDGWKDLFHANGHVYPFLKQAGLNESYYQPSSLFQNRRDGTFEEVTQLAGSGMNREIVGRGTAISDYDNDGDLDLLVANLGGRPLLLQNDLPQNDHWIQLRLQGRDSNRDGIGTRVELISSGSRQIWEVKRNVGIFSSSDPRVHFGLGTRSKAEVIRVFWPDGGIQEFEDIPGGRQYRVDEKTGLTPLPVQPPSTATEYQAASPASGKPGQSLVE